MTSTFLQYLLICIQYNTDQPLTVFLRSKLHLPTHQHDILPLLPPPPPQVASAKVSPPVTADIFPPTDHIIPQGRTPAQGTQDLEAKLPGLGQHTAITTMRITRTQMSATMVRPISLKASSRSRPLPTNQSGR